MLLVQLLIVQLCLVLLFLVLLFLAAVPGVPGTDLHSRPVPCTMYQCVFKNANQKDICAFIVFKAESKPKHEETCFGGVFLKKPKTHFFGGPNCSF